MGKMEEPYDKRRCFNTTGACNPQEHYMVDIRQRLEKIKKLVDAGEYFTINRARQYGKTTTIRALTEYLKKAYIVISLDFQRMSNAEFAEEHIFSSAFAAYFLRTVANKRNPVLGLDKTALDRLERVSGEEPLFSLGKLFTLLSELCDTAERPIVLIIDEIDSAANNQVFLDFLAQLRSYYLDRENSPTFQSVILAGVYDVKNIKRRFRPDEAHKMNSPWNIAADFKVDMSFSRADIAGMLQEYEMDHNTGMDVGEMADLIFDYTSGYPFLVSRICKLMDEDMADRGYLPENTAVWTKAGFLGAVKLLLSEKNMLFESLVAKLTDFPELKEILYALLFRGKEIPYNALNQSIETAEMFGFIKNTDGRVAIANRIFETVLYNLFLSEEVVGSRIYDSALQDRNQFIVGGRLNMKLVLEKFVEAFDYLYSDKNERFLEEVGRKYFMLFLKPIINGTGNSYVESRTRNMKRTDIIVDYLGEQFVVELKIWSGPQYHAAGEEQVAEYLDYYHLKTGYMLIFNFNKKKKIGVNEVRYGDKLLVEAVV